jgi:hypothetical protein
MHPPASMRGVSFGEKMKKSTSIKSIERVGSINIQKWSKVETTGQLSNHLVNDLIILAGVIS